MGRYCYFAVESPLSGWKKTNCYHAENRRIPTTEHHKAGPLDIRLHPHFNCCIVSVTHCQNDGRNRPVSSTSSQRRDPAFGERGETKTRNMLIMPNTNGNIFVPFVRFIGTSGRQSACENNLQLRRKLELWGWMRVD